MMRVSRAAFCLMLAVAAAGSPATEAGASQKSRNQAKCVEFGFRKGTDGFANCMLQLSMGQQSEQPPSHFDQVDEYRELSTVRMGDDRFPVCAAGDMDTELDITINKWVGPNCQLAPD